MEGDAVSCIGLKRYYQNKKETDWPSELQLRADPPLPRKEKTEVRGWTDLIEHFRECTVFLRFSALRSYMAIIPNHLLLMPNQKVVFAFTASLSVHPGSEYSPSFSSFWS